MLTFNHLSVAAISAGLAAAQTALTVNYGSTLQTMDGFGVSQAFGRASTFQSMASGPQKQGLDYLFSTTTGAGLTIIRNRIGSGGSGDSIEPNSPGSPSAKPTYVWDNNDSGQVWFSKQAMSYGVKTIYADAWSAPGFMKTNGNQNNGGYLCGVTGHSCSSGDWRQAYANFLTQYVKDYASAGITITHLGFLNEPDYVTAYSSMQSDGTMAASFIPILSNTVKSAGFSSIKLTCCDAVGWNDQKTMTSQLVAAGMESYLSVITSHMYSSDPTSPQNTRLPTWITEAADLSSAWTATWYASGGPAEGLTWASKIAVGVINANLSAYLYWEGLEVNESGSSSYLVASNGNSVTPSGRLWAFAMWSRFVRPGAKRLASSGTMSSVVWGAFKNTDGSVVAVFTNTGGSAQSAKVSFSGFTPSVAVGYLTDNSHTVASTPVTLSGGAAVVSIPAHSVVTIQLTGGGSNNGGSPPPTSATSSTVQLHTTTTTTAGSTGPTSGNGGSGCTADHWAQCGGQGYTGCTTCAAGYTCQASNQWYSQCL